MKINRIIIRDGNLSLIINEFLEKFGNYIIISFINFFSGYNQIELNEKSRDLINFYTSIKFYRMTIFFIKRDKFSYLVYARCY